MQRSALFVLAFVSLSGCGGSAKPSSGYNRPSAASYSAAQVARALGVTKHPGGQYTNGIPTDPSTGCVVDAFLLTPDQVKQYADAGDPVATNPSGSVGVKVGSYQGVDTRMCFDKFQSALKSLQ